MNVKKKYVNLLKERYDMILVKKMKKKDEWALETCLAQTRQKRVGGVGQIKHWA